MAKNIEVFPYISAIVWVGNLMTPVIPGVIPSIWNSLTYPSDVGGASDKNPSTPIQVTGLVGSGGISPDVKFPGLCRKPPRED